MSQQYSTQVVILGAGRALRGDVPSAMQAAGGGERVLDWILHAFEPLPEARVSFVAGFQADLLRGRYPEIEFVVNPRWKSGGAGESLSYARLDPELPVWVSYADIVYRSDIVEMLEGAAGEVVLAVDASWKTRYARRARVEMLEAEKVRFDQEGRLEALGKGVPLEETSAEFCGLAKFSPRAVVEISRIFRARSLPADATMLDIIELLVEQGIDVRCVDVHGRWAELTAPQDLAQFVLGTKAESLARLRPLLNQGTAAVIGELLSFTHRDWKKNPGPLVEKVSELFGKTSLIVRSSAQNEDGWDESAAGAFDSVAGVDSQSAKAISEAVELVFASYGQPNDDNHVLVQELVQDVACSGVVMTRVPATLAPYFVINFDSTTKRTDTVTSGAGSEVRTVYLQKDAALRSALGDVIGPVVRAVKELEQLVGHDSLDIEFATTSSGEVHILQVRPIAAAHKARPLADDAIVEGIADARALLEASERAPHFQVGKRAPLSVMTDWNPAEIVGTVPKRLAVSLYEYLITDEVWAAQRARNGYRDVRPSGLLVDVLGHPYVNVRASFNSFVPASLPETLAERLINESLDMLVERPELHDKVEFDILTTCLDFDWPSAAKKLRGRGWGTEEVELLRAGLVEVTRNSIRSTKEDLRSLGRLTSRYEVIRQTKHRPLERAFTLLQDARAYGTPLFANLARSGFVAVSLLKSLEAVGLTTSTQTDAFQRSVSTVSTELQSDAWLVKKGKLSWESFVEKYGHLRPGTYDICSPRYADLAETYLRPIVERATGSHSAELEKPIWSAEDRENIAAHLGRMDLGINVSELEQFIRDGIEGRELGKFLFTRNLSDALEAFAEFGEAYGLGREELAMVRVEEYLRLRGAPTAGWLDELKATIVSGRESHQLKQAFAFPQFISSPRDLECFEQFRVEANYVTRKKARGELVVLEAGGPQKDVRGKIVLVPNADPGFDWLFGQEIAGLITGYGGVNSHMAIRAAEFGLPAAIGVGEAEFERIASHKNIELDCEVLQIRCT